MRISLTHKNNPVLFRAGNRDPGTMIVQILLAGAGYEYIIKHND